jgi:hypothetical protein
MKPLRFVLGLAFMLGLAASPPATATAGPFFFSTGNPDGLMATGSRPSSAGKIEIETGDDFILSSLTKLNSATFTGLLPGGAPLSSITEVRVEIYRVFPKDSTFPPSGNVLTRVNSPSDAEFLDRDTASSNLAFTTSIVSSSFLANNSVLNGINKLPNQFTGGEGPVSGQEVEFDVSFLDPILLPADHYFFVPQVQLSDGDFFWLSAPKPIVPPGTPFAPDLQTWIRNEDLAPDWSRVGTDITHQGPFNAAFSLTGQAVPEPASMTLLGLGSLCLVGCQLRRRRFGR